MSRSAGKEDALLGGFQINPNKIDANIPHIVSRLPINVNRRDQTHRDTLGSNPFNYVEGSDDHCPRKIKKGDQKMAKDVNRVTTYEYKWNPKHNGYQPTHMQVVVSEMIESMPEEPDKIPFSEKEIKDIKEKQVIELKTKAAPKDG
jgi:hypothetical protein